MYGQYLTLVQCIILSLVWFSVQSWTGGLCIQNVLAAIFPSYQNMPNHFLASANPDTKQFIGWVVFNVAMVRILYIRPEWTKTVVLWMNVRTLIDATPASRLQIRADIHSFRLRLSQP